MRTLETEIIIDAPVETVWDILTDFPRYPEWNPFIKSIEGKPETGSKLKVVIQPPDSKPMTFRPTCLESDANRTFRWLGHLGFKGIFDGEHIFQLEKMDSNCTRFIHKESFNGILVPLLWKQLDSGTRKGFVRMNEELKERSENFSSL